MSLLAIIVLALVQGITEFLPISSSGHLILAPKLFGWSDQGLAFDIAVHVGGLAAVVFYFREELVRMSVGVLGRLRGGESTDETRLAFAVVLGTLPAVLVGLSAKGWIETALRSPLVIATTTVIFGVLLGVADRRGARRREEASITWVDALLVGAAQALALIPGTSRSGVTITAGLFLGLRREAATRFSFLLSIPTILGAGLLQSVELVQSGTKADPMTLVLGAGLSAVSAYLCIRLFLGVIEKLGMMPFVAYRLILGVALFVAFYGT